METPSVDEKVLVSYFDGMVSIVIRVGQHFLDVADRLVLRLRFQLELQQCDETVMGLVVLLQVQTGHGETQGLAPAVEQLQQNIHQPNALPFRENITQAWQFECEYGRNDSGRHFFFKKKIKKKKFKILFFLYRKATMMKAISRLRVNSSADGGGGGVGGGEEEILRCRS